MDWGALAGLLILLSIIHALFLMLLTVQGASVRLLSIFAWILIALALSGAASALVYVAGGTV